MCQKKDYIKIHDAKPRFTWYANTTVSESYAEHGGYISAMLSNPELQKKKITVKLLENGQEIEKDINFEEYKNMYPKHYDYFIKLIKGEIKCY